MSTDRIISYVKAESLCRGSLGDDNYSTCVLNNLRFLPYSNDKAKALAKSSAGLLTKGDIPYLDGKTYVKGKPIALSDASVSMLQKNDYGQVGFRCLDVAARPMLPLMDLVDLGLEDKPLVVLSNIDLPTTATVENLCDISHGYISGVPVKCPESCTTNDCLYETYLYNLKNYLIHLNNKYQTTLSNCDAISNLISSQGNYDNLRPLALEAEISLQDLDIINDILINMLTEINLLPLTQDNYTFINQVINAIYTHLPSKTLFTTEANKLNTNIVQVILSKVTVNEDWTQFLYYTELDGIVTYMAGYRATDNYTFITDQMNMTMQYINSFPYVPVVDSSNDSFSNLVGEVGISFNYEIYNILTTTLTKIHELYTLSNVSLNVTTIKQNNKKYNLFSLSESVWHTNVKSLLTSNLFNNPQVLDILELYSHLESIQTLYSSVDTFITNLTDSVTEQELNLFYANTGNTILISLSSFYGKLQEILGLAPQSLTEVNLGGSFKDSGRYYYSNVAYAIGFGKLTNIYSIRINGAVYTTDEILDDNNNPITGISDSGCTRYKMRFKLFPDVANNSNVQLLEMYIYPGTATQPYCPTINKYHNFAACKYSGLFSKLIPSSSSDSSEIGLFMYKGYSPLSSTVDEIIRLGTADLNAIDLTKPDLDKDDTEAFLEKEIVSLTNSSSLIASATITSKDLKYYLKSTLQGQLAPIELNNPFTTQGLVVPKASNYPYMSIIEFISMPLGNSFKVPEVEVYLKAEDIA